MTSHALLSMTCVPCRVALLCAACSWAEGAHHPPPPGPPGKVSGSPCPHSPEERPRLLQALQSPPHRLVLSVWPCLCRSINCFAVLSEEAPRLFHWINQHCKVGGRDGSMRARLNSQGVHEAHNAVCDQAADRMVWTAFTDRTRTGRRRQQVLPDRRPLDRLVSFDLCNGRH